MRLIDADALELFIARVRKSLYLDHTLSDIPTRDSMLLNFQQYVHLQPTIDAMPVVRGEWIENPTKDSVICSYCYADWNIFDNDTYRFQHCPNCGAKMEDKP